MAASLPEASISPYKSCSMVSLSPTLSPAILDALSRPKTSSPTVTSSVSLEYFNAKYAVIIFVVLAGSILLKQFLEKSTLELLISQRTPASA